MTEYKLNDERNASLGRNVDVNGTVFGLDDDNRLHSVRADLRPPDAAAILIPKGLEEYGREIAGLLHLGQELEKRYEAIARVERMLRENGCTPPRPDLSPHLRASWRVYRGELL